MECPACERECKATETAVRDLGILCKKHREEIDSYLSSIVLTVPPLE